LINLMTGMLRPDGGQILLGGEDITALGPEERVRRGLVRTFQINSLFPHLTPLEAVTLTICEREKIARTWWRPTSDYRAAVDEAYAVLEQLMLGPVCTRETRGSSLTASSGFSKSRWRSRPGRRCSCSTSPPPACRARKALSCSAPSPACRRTSPFCSSSTTWSWCFGLAEPHHRHGRRRILLEGTPDQISADPRVSAKSISEARRMVEPLLSFKNVRAGYGEAVVLDDISFAMPERGSLAVLGRNGVGKSTLLLTLMGFTQLRRGAIVWRGTDITRLAPHRRAQSGIGWVAQEREIFANLSVVENLTVASRPGRWDLGAVFELFPRLKERQQSKGNQLSGGEQQMLATARALMTNPALLCSTSRWRASRRSSSRSWCAACAR
jgi:ABC-type branched-subunit amino acid transport system ATPase component